MFFESISFKNNQWEQNRPEELARLMECVRKEGRLGEILRGKIQKDKRYSRPYIGDYQFELAKDILKCSPVRQPRIEKSHSLRAFWRKKKE